MRENNRLGGIIDMLGLVTEEQTNWRIELAKGKYKLPRTFKAGIKLGKRIRKYGKDNDKLRDNKQSK